MMKLSTMLKVDSTVNTQWQSRIAEQILEHWEHDQGSAQFFRSSTNFVYVFRKGGERSFLRFADSAERTGAAIEAEMALLGFVASKGMTVTTPLRPKMGDAWKRSRRIWAPFMRSCSRNFKVLRELLRT